MDVTLPDGQTIKDVPDGTTKAQLAEKLTANGFNVPADWMGAPPTPASPSQIPGAPQPQKNAKQETEPSFWDRVKAVPETIGKVGTTLIGTPIAGVQAAIEKPFKGDGSRYDDPNGWAARREAELLSGWMGTPSKGAEANLDSIRHALDAAKIPPLMPQIGALPKVASAVKGATPRAIAAQAARALPELSPEAAELAQKAHAFGIKIPPDMLTDNTVVRSMGEALRKIPLSGAKTEANQVAFNKALIKMIGGDGERLTPDVFDRAMTKSGEKIGEIYGKTPIPVTTITPVAQRLVSEAQRFETSDVAKVVNSYAEELANIGKQNGGIIPGESFRKINSKLGAQMRQTSNGDLKHALGEFQDAMHDALEANVKSPEMLAELKDARTQYAIGKSLEPLVAKSETGDISPASLMSAATSDKAKKTAMARGRAGDLGDLARIGQRFMKEPKSSGTAERGLAYGALGGAGYVNPGAAAGVWGAANAYNRLGPSLSRAIVNRSRPLTQADIDLATKYGNGTP